MSRKKIKKKPARPQYPAATLAFYGPTDQLATKAVVSIIKDQRLEPSNLRKWFTESTDIREDRAISEEIAAYLREHGVKQTISPDRIIGCPHEEGVDYPVGEACPKCPFWFGRKSRCPNL